MSFSEAGASTCLYRLKQGTWSFLPISWIVAGPCAVEHQGSVWAQEVGEKAAWMEACWGV